MDLIAQLRAKLDEVEQDADDFHHVDCERVRDPAYPMPCTCGEPKRREAMVAAHRKILDEHTASSTAEVFGEVSTITYCPVCYHGCPTLEALAEGYGIVAA